MTGLLKIISDFFSELERYDKEFVNAKNYGYNKIADRIDDSRRRFVLAFVAKYGLPVMYDAVKTDGKLSTKVYELDQLIRNRQL